MSAAASLSRLDSSVALTRKQLSGALGQLARKNPVP
jgi:hypothetical protein